MRIHKFSSTDAFVAIDLVGVQASSGPLRWARRVLHSGAQELARSQTYTYAALNMRYGGASGGISAPAPQRAEAVAAFVSEAESLVTEGTFLPDAAKGLNEADLAPLRASDPRDVARLASGLEKFGSSFVDGCEGLSAAVCADHWRGDEGGLSGRSVAIEGFGANGAALAAEVVERGGVVRAVATAKGCVSSDSGFEPDVLRDAWQAHGIDMVTKLDAVVDAEQIFERDAEIYFVGSKMGVVNHKVAEQLVDAKAVVACGRIPLTARALAVFRDAGVAAPADFVALSGASIALWGDHEHTEQDILSDVAEKVSVLAAEVANHDDGPFLAACYAAESFLSSWQTELPFGRPLAP